MEMDRGRQFLMLQGREAWGFDWELSWSIILRRSSSWVKGKKMHDIAWVQHVQSTGGNLQDPSPLMGAVIYKEHDGLQQVSQLSCCSPEKHALVSTLMRQAQSDTHTHKCAQTHLLFVPFILSLSGSLLFPHTQARTDKSQRPMNNQRGWVPTASNGGSSLSHSFSRYSLCADVVVL